MQQKASYKMSDKQIVNFQGANNVCYNKLSNGVLFIKNGFQEVILYMGK
jgi:hypothetical protein